MHCRNPIVFALAGLLFFAAFAAAGVTGTLRLDGKRYEISSVLAKTQENPSDDSKKDIAVLLTDTVLTLDQFDMSSLYEMSMEGKVHGVLLTLNDDRDCTGLTILGVTQRTGTGLCDFDAEAFDVSTISGRVSKPYEVSSGHNYEFNIRFDSPVIDAVTKPVDAMTGTELPAGGGDPGRAYLEYDRAIRSGNIAALKKFAPSEDAARQLDAPDVKKVLESMRSVRATGLKVARGFINGNRATLIVEGKDSATGRPAAARVLMVQSGRGQWKVEGETWKEQEP